MNINIYYSRSNEVPDDTEAYVYKFIENLPMPKDHVNLQAYLRGTTYSRRPLERADLVIVGVRDMNEDVPDIAKGCYTEIDYAFRHKIPVLLLRFKGRKSTTAFVQQITEQDLNRNDGQGAWRIGYGWINNYDDPKECRHTNTPYAYIHYPDQIEKMLKQLMGQRFKKEVSYQIY